MAGNDPRHQRSRRDCRNSNFFCTVPLTRFHACTQLVFGLYVLGSFLPSVDFLFVFSGFRFFARGSWFQGSNVCLSTAVEPTVWRQSSSYTSPNVTLRRGECSNVLMQKKTFTILDNRVRELVFVVSVRGKSNRTGSTTHDGAAAHTAVSRPPDQGTPQSDLDVKKKNDPPAVLL